MMIVCLPKAIHPELKQAYIMYIAPILDAPFKYIVLLVNLSLQQCML